MEANTKKTGVKGTGAVVAVAAALAAVAALPVAAIAVGCAEEGEEGSAAVDCGAHGTEHDGHCHCDDGYLFDGTTCVTPGEIAAACGSGEVPEHAACLCPEDGGTCPCEEGEIETYDGLDYCVPILHEEGE